ncbi:MAG TPA: septum site-determining protein Ssd [Nocardioidaceae bacterium]|nr:septum site-determining protein Ssd [Nocardioidaceae bacterium]
MHAPLLVTGDTDLLDDLLRLSAAAGVVLDVAHDPGSAVRQWATAPLVLVGPDLSASMAAQTPPRRADVFLLARGEPDYRAAVSLGASDVITLPAAEAWLVERLTDVGDGGARSALTLGFVGGSGGVGATTLACATAGLASQSRDTALVDLDPLGAGVERIIGMDETGVGWADLVGSRGRLGSRALRESLPYRDGLAVLGWGGRPADETDDVAVREAFAAARRGHDLVVADLPRVASAAAAEVLARCDAVILVAGCSVPGAAAALRLLATFAPLSGSVHLVGRETGGAVSSAALAEALGLELIGVLDQQKSLAEHLDLGLGPLHARRGAVAQAALEVLTRMAPA